MTWLFGAALLAALALGAALIRSTAEFRLAKGRLQAVEQDLERITGLIEHLNGSDWQRSVHGILTALSEGGYGRAFALLGLSDAGSLEVRAFAGMDGEPTWDPLVSDPAAYKALRSRSPYPGEHGTVYLPLLEEDEPVGLLAVRGGAIDSAVLHTAARLAELALTGLRYLRRQAALSSTDGLTGLANHRHFQQTLGITLGQAYLEGGALALILLDIDRFKSVNDTYGHLFGDLVLREIAEEIRRSIAAHEALDFTSGIKLRVTVSLGVARYELGQGKSRLIARADEALYASKHAGRNRVTIAPIETVT